MKKRIIICALILLAVLLASCSTDSGAAEYVQQIQELQAQIQEQEAFRSAVLAFSEEQSRLAAQNTELLDAISQAEQLLSGELPEVVAEASGELAAAVASARDGMEDLPVIPGSTAEISAAAAKMAAVDYTQILSDIGSKQAALETEVTKLQRVTQPSADAVAARLSTVPGVVEVAAATEEHDPNRKLNQDGGYTAAVFFLHENFGQNPIGADAVLDRGTDGGGCIEVYRTEADAMSRNTFLVAFDGSALDSGSHTVIGTCVIRTSSKLPADLQAALEAQIIQALICE